MKAFVLLGALAACGDVVDRPREEPAAFTATCYSTRDDQIVQLDFVNEDIIPRQFPALATGVEIRSLARFGDRFAACAGRELHFVGATDAAMQATDLEDVCMGVAGDGARMFVSRSLELEEHEGTFGVPTRRFQPIEVEGFGMSSTGSLLVNADGHTVELDMATLAGQRLKLDITNTFGIAEHGGKLAVVGAEGIFIVDRATGAFDGTAFVGEQLRGLVCD